MSPKWRSAVGRAATFAAVALIAASPVFGLDGPASQRDAPAATPALPVSLAIDYNIKDGALQACRVRKSTGDEDIDLAICGLLQRCVAAGNTTDQAAMACLAPQYNRLAEMVGSGLLAALDEAPPPDAAQEVADAAARDEDIVVTARRTPRPGLWLISERGRRTMFAQNGMVFTLPPRNWRRCIRRSDLAEVMAEMMRFDRRGVALPGASGPCNWDVTMEQDGLRGRQRCTIRGGMLTGKMKGQASDARFTVERETRYRQLGEVTALQRERRRVMEEFGELVAGTEDELYPRLPAADLRRIPADVRDATQDNLDEVTVTGFRVGACPIGADTDAGAGGDAGNRAGGA